MVWRLLAPHTSSSGLAAIGAGTFFIVFAGQTLGMILRDITAGAAMIIEGWLHVGDFIKIEPFMDLSGMVERFTLRSTKLRSLSGSVI
ncbi:MAG: mechanosensitive ion channel domain-containing protein [Candidatus Saccharimonadales bacterium]